MKFVFTSDWHWGVRNNDPEHSKDLHAFIDFLIEYCRENSIEILVHGGDWYHQRDKLDVSTIQSSIEGAKKLNSYFKHWYQIKGNHDLYHRDTRNVCSLEILKPYATLVDRFFELDQGKVVLSSWLTSESEYQELSDLTKKLGTEFVLGHFEFNRFMLNDHYEVEHGMSHKELSHVGKVLSGHFHSRQKRDNVVYIGTPFGYDFNDANDPERGFVVVDSDNKKIEFVDYNGPLFISVDQDDFLDDDLDLSNLGNQISLRVVVERPLNESENIKLQEKLKSSLARETKVVHRTTAQKEAINQKVEIGEILTVDQAVSNHLSNMTGVEGIDRDILLEIYRKAIEEGND